MRFVCNKRPIRGRFYGSTVAKGLVAEADIYVHPRGRLAAKLLVFDRPRSLHRFWKRVNPSERLGRNRLGVVNSLSRERLSFRGGKERPAVYEGDRRYFCLIGLCVGHLTMEILTHESVHAGFCYAKRVGRNLFGPAAEFDEERIAYPAGIIAASVNRYLHKKGLYPQED